MTKAKKRCGTDAGDKPFNGDKRFIIVQAKYLAMLNVFIGKDGSKIIGIGESAGEGIADCGFGVWRGGSDEALANARLIASAPDLYEVANTPTIYLVEEDERVHLTIDGELVGAYQQESKIGIALLKFDAEQRAAISKANGASS